MAPATPSPSRGFIVEVDDAARENGLCGFDVLACPFESDVVEAAERGQARAGEGGVKHVEVF